MKNKELMMRFAAVGMSATKFCTTPMTTLATELQTKLQEESVEATSYNNSEQETGFVIEDGVLIKYTGTAEQIVIPDGVIEIGERAFYYCINLTSITIPNSVIEEVHDFLLAAEVEGDHNVFIELAHQ